MLSDLAITAAIEAGNLRIDPWDDELLQPASVDLRLGRQFRVFTTHRHTLGDLVIDPAVRQDGLTTLVHVAKDEPFILHPGAFALAHTYEHVRFGTGHAGRVEGKSSLGRLGLVCHSTAGFIDPGFTGQITLELSNVNVMPIKLYPGMKIAQLCVFGVQGKVGGSYGLGARGSRYQGQTGATPSRSWKSWRVWDVA